MTWKWMLSMLRSRDRGCGGACSVVLAYAFGQLKELFEVVASWVATCATWVTCWQLTQLARNLDVVMQEEISKFITS